MGKEYFLALAAMTTPVMLGKVSLMRGLLIVFVFGIVLIALSLAHNWFQGLVELEQQKRHVQVLAELDLSSDVQPCALEPLQSEAIKSAYDLSLSLRFVLQKDSVVTQESNIKLVVETVEPTIDICPAKTLA